MTVPRVRYVPGHSGGTGLQAPPHSERSGTERTSAEDACTAAHARGGGVLVCGGAGVRRVGNAALELGRVDPLGEEIGRHVLVGDLDEARLAAGDALLQARMRAQRPVEHMVVLPEVWVSHR